MSDKRGWRKRGKNKKGSIEVTSPRSNETSRTLDDIDEGKVTECNGELSVSSSHDNRAPGVITIYQHTPMQHQPPPLPLPVSPTSLEKPTSPVSSPRSPAGIRQLPKLNPPPGAKTYSSSARSPRNNFPPTSLSHDTAQPIGSNSKSSSSFTVTADIESPQEINNVKSWPGSPVKDKINSIEHVSTSKSADKIQDTRIGDQNSVTSFSSYKPGGGDGTKLTTFSSYEGGDRTKLTEESSSKAQGERSQLTSFKPVNGISGGIGPRTTLTNNAITLNDQNNLIKHTDNKTDQSNSPREEGVLPSYSGTMPTAVAKSNKLSRTPSLSKSKSDEALAGKRIKPSSRKLDTHPPPDDALNVSFDSADKSSNPFGRTESNKLGRGSGKESPGSESVASLMSQATVITHTGGPLDSPHARGSQKHTLGEILKHIDLKSQNLLEREDFTGATTLPDLTFLAHQSRYNADPQIKRRLMSRLAECHIVQIFLRVLKSVRAVDYLQTLDPPPQVGDGLVPGSGSGAAGLPPHPLRGSAQGDSPRIHSESPRGPRRPLDMMSEPGVDARSMLSERLHNVPHSMKNLRAALTLLVNCSDKSSSVCDQCIQSPLVAVLLDELSQTQFHGTEAMRDQNRMYLVKGYLGILLNVIKHQPEARDLYRDAGVVKVLQQYLKSSLLMVKTRTLLLLSYVIGEAENEVVNSTDRHLGLLVKMLQGALESDGHFSKKYGLSAAELTSAINRFASCESNKVRLCRRGALPLYTQLLGGTEEEQMLGAKGLWTLAFSEENRSVIQQDTACLQGLENIESNSHREEIRKTASGALWVIREHHIPVRPVGSEYSSDPDVPQHVLVSYQWGAKTLVFKIKERLKAAGYKVCTDVEDTAVPIMDGMAGAVSRAAVVLLCLTHRFKESPSCRTEAEYAWHGGRQLIPLKLQPHYTPEGWVTPLVDGRLTFDLSSDDNLDTLLPNLIREIGNRGRVRVIEQFDVLLGGSSSSLPKIHDVATQTVDIRDTTAGWSPDDVTRWLKAHDLAALTDKLKHVNGVLLLEIKKMQREAPESFYSTLKNELKLNFLSTLKFTRALDML